MCWGPAFTQATSILPQFTHLLYPTPPQQPSPTKQPFRSNPQTPRRLYFEPITVEDVLNVIDKERPEGIIVQFGGQTPLKIANDLQRALDENPIPAASGASR